MRSFEDLHRANLDKYIEEISFMKPRLIGLIEGNHHFKFASGLTSTQIMCEKLGTKYLGEMSVIFLTLVQTNSTNNSTKKFMVTICIHHGRGGGKRTGASINNVEDLMRVVEADIYLMGHDHQKWIVDKARLRPVHGNGIYQLKQRDIILARMGSYQMGYVSGKSSYPVQLAATPSKLGGIEVVLTPYRKDKGSGKNRSYDQGVHLTGGLV